MTLYATVAELREMLPQVPAGATEDALLTYIKDRKCGDNEVNVG